MRYEAEGDLHCSDTIIKKKKIPILQIVNPTILFM